MIIISGVFCQSVWGVGLFADEYSRVYNSEEIRKI